MIKQIKKIFRNLLDKWFGFSKKRRTFLTISFCLIFLIFISPLFVRGAGDTLSSAIGQILTNIILFFVDLASTLVILEMKIMVYLAQWRSFTKGVFAVEEGWKIVRDLCNMFFILILLVISFSTILKIESYAYKKWLAKLVIFAIVINFSKTITGLLIDFSQVIMLTFVSSFQAATAGNLAKGLHLGEFLKADSSGNIEASDSWTMFGAAVLALILMSVFGIVMLIMIVMLMGRIVTLWVLTILSPIAYLLQASPIGTKYANQWWEEFSKNLISGPVLAFFLWLALFTIQNASEKQLVDTLNEQGSAQKPDEKGSKLANQTVGQSSSATGTEVGKASVLLDYIVVIALLMAAIKVAQSMGVIGSQFAGSMMSNMNSFAGKAARFAVKTPLKGALGLTAWADRKTLSKWGIGVQSTKMWAQGVKDSFADTKDKDILDIRQRAAGRTGFSGLAFGGARGKEHANRYLEGTLAIPGMIHAFKDTFNRKGYQADQIDKAQKEQQRLEDLKDNMGNVVYSETEQEEKKGAKQKEIEEAKKVKTKLKEEIRDNEIRDAKDEGAILKSKSARTKEEDDRLKMLEDKITKLEADKENDKDIEDLEKEIKELEDNKFGIEIDIKTAEDERAILDAKPVKTEQEEQRSIELAGIITKLEGDKATKDKDITEKQEKLVEKNPKKLPIESDKDIETKLNNQIKELDNSKIGKSKKEKKEIDEDIAEKRDQLEKLKALQDEIQGLEEEKKSIELFDIDSGDFEAILKLQLKEEIENIDKDKSLNEVEKVIRKQDAKGDYKRKRKEFNELKKPQKKEEKKINKEYKKQVEEIQNRTDLNEDQKKREIDELGKKRDEEIKNSVEGSFMGGFIRKKTRTIAPDKMLASIEEEKQAELSKIPDYTPEEKLKEEVKIDKYYDKKKAKKEIEKESIISEYEAKKIEIEQGPDDDLEKRIKLNDLERIKDKKLKKAKVTDEDFEKIEKDRITDKSQIGPEKKKRLAKAYDEKKERYEEYKKQQDIYREQEEKHIRAQYNAEKEKTKKEGEGHPEETGKKLNDLLKAFKEKIKKANFDFDAKISNFGNRSMGNITREDFIKGIDKQIQSKKTEINRRKDAIASRSMLGTSARTAHRELVDKKAKELSGIDNYAELISAFRTAMASGDKYTAIAATEKLAKDANLNELLKEYGKDSTGIGQTQFFKEIMGKKFHMGEQEYLSAQNDVSYVAERAGHWDQARTVRVKPNGKFECMIKDTGKKDSKGNAIYDDSAHAEECFADIMKMDPQVIARNLNRLAYGGENGKTGKFQMSTLGAMLIKALSSNTEFMDKHVGRWNINITENLSQETEFIKKLLVDNPRGLQKTLDALAKSSGSSMSGKISSPQNILKDIKRIIEERNRTA